MRSKSAETVRSRPEADAHHELSEHSLKQLNKVLEMYALAPSTWEHQMSLESPTIEGYVGQAVCVQALSVGRKALREETDECLPVRTLSKSSISTVSTMASEDAAEHGGRPRTSLLSSSSFDTMFSSDSDECQTPLKGVDFQQEAHKSAPRKHNSASMYEDSCRDPSPTTMMIRNIPRRYSQEFLLMDLHDLGFDGTFDFLHIPTDNTTLACVGYAFVNFIEPCWAEQCIHAFKDYKFKRHSRGMSKVAKVSVAHLQGAEKNLQNYEDSVMVSKNEMQRPLVLFSTANSSNSEA
jgi:hypothetical protein